MTRKLDLDALAGRDPIAAGTLAMLRLRKAEDDERAKLDALVAALSEDAREEADVYVRVRRRIEKLDRTLRETTPAARPPSDGAPAHAAARRAVARNLVVAGGLVWCVGVLAQTTDAAGVRVFGALAALVGTLLLASAALARRDAARAQARADAGAADVATEREHAEAKRERIAYLLGPEVRRARAFVREHEALAFDRLGE